MAVTTGERLACEFEKPNAESATEGCRPLNLTRLIPAEEVEAEMLDGWLGDSATEPRSGPSRMTGMVGAALVSAMLLTGCAGRADSNTPANTDVVGDAISGPDSAPESTGEVTLITHDSWATSPDVIAQFEHATGLHLTVLPVGDAGTLANQVVLTKDAPLGDVVFGIDNSFSSRVEAAGAIDGGLHPVTQGDVCINVDSAWFAAHGVAEPNTLDDLVKPEYSGLTVVLNPATSSPGLAFLLGTVGAFGDVEADGTRESAPRYDASWQAYWQALRANDVAVAESWTDGYYAQFTGAGEGGTRPIVVSYATSPAFTVVSDPDGTQRSTTRALLGTCFRQTEYAGVLTGAANPVGGQKLVDFLRSAPFQADVPGQMYMYPVDEAATLPADWVQFAPQAERPFEVSPQDIDANRDRWIEEWNRIVVE
jgi:thiamine transport system substrate-binding protein